jgi:hypothetical protein
MGRKIDLFCINTVGLGNRLIIKLFFLWQLPIAVFLMRWRTHLVLFTLSADSFELAAAKKGSKIETGRKPVNDSRQRQLDLFSVDDDDVPQPCVITCETMGLEALKSRSSTGNYNPVLKPRTKNFDDADVSDFEVKELLNAPTLDEEKNKIFSTFPVKEAKILVNHLDKRTTKKGKIRTDVEILQFVKSDYGRRKAASDRLKKTRTDNDKSRKDTRSSLRAGKGASTGDGHFFNVEKAAPIAVPEELIKLVKVNKKGYTPEETAAWNKARALERRLKKRAKTKRQKQRDVGKESNTAPADVKKANRKAMRKRLQDKKGPSDIVFESDVSKGPSFLGKLATTVATGTVYDLVSKLGYIEGNEIIISLVSFYVSLFTATSHREMSLATVSLRLALGLKGESMILNNRLNEIQVKMSQFKAECSEFVDFGGSRLDNIINDYKMYTAAEELKDDFDSSDYDPDDVAPESLSDQLNSLAGLGAALMSTQLVNALQTLFMSLVSLKFFDRDLAASITKVVGKAEKKLSIPQTLVLVIKNVAVVVKAGELVLQGMPLTEVLLSEDPMTALQFKARELLRFKDALYFGLPVPGKRCARVMIVELTSCIDSAKSMMQKLRTTSPAYQNLADLEVALRDFKFEVRSMLDGQKREAPFGACIFSPPGFGKSSVVELVCRNMAHLRGDVYDGSMIFRRTKTSDYMEGYDADSKPYIHYGEVGSVSKQIARTKGDPLASELLEMVDNCALPVDMAGLPFKGKNFARPQLVVIDTNNSNMNFDVISFAPAAEYRRFFFIEIKVKSEFRKPGRTTLDSTIPGEHFDKWLYRLTKREPDGNENFKEVVYLDFDSENNGLQGFTQVLQREMKKHIEIQQMVMNAPAPDLDFPPLEPEVNTFELKDDHPDDELYPVMDLRSESEIVSAVPVANRCNNLPLYVKEIAYATVSFSVEVLHSLFCLALCLIKRFLPTEGRPLFALLTTLMALFAMFGQFAFFMSVLLFIISQIDYKTFLYLIAKKKVSTYGEAIIAQKNRLYTSYMRTQSYLEGKFNPNDFLSNRYVQISAAVGATLSVIYVVNRLWSTNDNDEESGEIYEPKDDSPPPNAVDEALHLAETSTGCVESTKRLRGRKTFVWNTQIGIPPSVHMGTVNSLYDCISKNVKYCMVVNGSRRTKTHITGVSGNYAIINFHAIEGDEEITEIYVADNGLIGPNCPSFNVKIYWKEVAKVGADMCLIETNGQRYRNILSHFPTAVEEFHNAKGKNCRTDVIVNSNPLTIRVGDENYKIRHNVLYHRVGHAPGECGTPVVARRDAGVCIVGIHAAGRKSTSTCYAEVVLRGNLEVALKELQTGHATNIISSASGQLQDLKLQEPHYKSPVRFMNLGAVRYYGCTGEIAINQKSNLKRTPFRTRDLDAFFLKEFNVKRTEEYGRPSTVPGFDSSGQWIDAYQVGLKKIGKTKKALDPKVLKMAEEIIFQHVIEKLDVKFTPLLSKIAINGADVDYYVRSMDMKKSAGFGKKGVKKNYFYEYENEKFPYVPVEELILEILDILEMIKNGEMPLTFYKGCFKDEPRVKAKCASGSTRIFYASPLAMLIAHRMYLMHFYTTMVEKCELFCAAIGVDMVRDGHVLYDRLKSFSPLIIEGDYSGFDVSMPFDVGRTANNLIYRWLERGGFPPAALEIVNGLLASNLFPVVVLRTEVIEVPGLQPSGMYATAENNSLKNLLMMVYIWYAEPETSALGNFFDYVLPLTYGDDLLAAVKPEASIYNTRHYEKMSEKHLGMKFTNAAKGDITSDFLCPDTMTFLKRNFVYSSVMEKVVCPLHTDSLYKTLEWYIPSKSVNVEAQLESMCNSTLREMILHCDGEEQYNRCHDFMTNVLVETFPGCAFNFPTFHTIRNSIMEIEDDETKTVEAEEDCDDIVFESQICPAKMTVRGGRLSVRRLVMFFITLFAMLACTARPVVADNTCHLDERLWIQGSFEDKLCLSTKLDDFITDLSERHAIVSKSLEEVKDIFPELIWRDVLTSALIPANSIAFKYYKEQMVLRNEEKALRLTMKHLKRRNKILRMRTNNRSQVRFESADIGDGNVESSSVQTFENVTDVAGLESDEKSAGYSEDLHIGQKNLVTMEDFLSRPVEITTYNVAVGADSDYSVEIWDAFLLNPAVRAKLRNYAFLRGDLVVRVMIAGSPFHYSKFQVSYQPFGAHNESLGYLSAAPAAARFNFLSYLSQAPGTAVIDVRDNQPMDMTCPYINVQPMIRLFNASPLILPSGTSYDDSASLGQLHINSINTVRAASATPSDITIFVYAHMENVELGTLTGTVLDIVSESGKMDEREAGPIERISSRLSSIATSLTVIPEIAPFAAASAVVLKGVSSIAALFGFSYPTMVNEPMRVKNEPYRNGANTIGFDLGKRITLDPKQELTVDPRVCGVSTDDMAISALCQRPTLLDTFTWNVIDVPMASAIWTVPVNPMIARRTSLGAPTPYLVTPTALSFAATPFWYWSGSITFTFDIVASQYHRGKFLVYFEPNISQNVAIDTDLDLNKQYTKIVDIQQGTTFSFTVEWAASRAWLRNMPNSLLGDIGGVGFLGSALADYANGYIAIVPFTELQSPDSSNIEINVYIHSDDMQFNLLTEDLMPPQRPATASGDLIFESADFSSISTVNSMPLNESSASKAGITELHFGEVPVSFRALCKRFTSQYAPSSYGVILTADLMLSTTIQNYLPPSPPFTGTGSVVTLMPYLRFAYLGIRGGSKHRINYIGDYSTALASSSRVMLKPPRSAETTFGVVGGGTLGAYRAEALGSITTVPATNGAVEFEMPLYTNNLFGLSFSTDPFPSTNTNFDSTLVRDCYHHLPISINDTGTVYPDYQWAAAEDFSLMRFQGGPPYQYF